MKEIQHYTSSKTAFQRFRHLRTDASVRDSHAEVKLSVNDFILPFFVVEGNNLRTEISTLPGVYHLSPDILLVEVANTVSLGINKILLFGVVDEFCKDESGSFASSPENPVNIAIRRIREHFPEITIITDVCLCAYTSHGHCGLLKGEIIDNDTSLDSLAEMALEHARAGADIVAPSAMMDGQVWAIRQLLDANGYQKVKVLAYSAKYASNLYGPFRGAANSKPSFGDRKTYQMDYRSASQAMDEMTADLNEGASFLMVKPAHTYLDIIRQASSLFPDTPMVAYHVSGEYMMIKAAAAAGILNEEQAALEIHTAIKRAGANWIISYYSPLLARRLREYGQSR
ncbi:MAG: porphobilinogen synthase [Bacteroidetes bacterium]|nr:porphobilinogen synthase [Bacteroidota bacterium]